MSNSNNVESKDENAEGKRVKNTLKRKKFRSFSLGKYMSKHDIFWWGSTKSSKFALVSLVRFRLIDLLDLKYFIQSLLISLNGPGSSQKFFVGNNW